jgi:hypothetical protein
MAVARCEDGKWTLQPEGDEHSDLHPAYVEALPRYLTMFDPAFTQARDRSEFEFLLSLFRVRGFQGPGWDPYKTTLQAIPALVKVHKEIKEFEAQRHLQLWIYGHILEASEPYEIIMNLIDVANGGRFRTERFPPHAGRRPLSPGEKIDKIKKASTAAGMPEVAAPLIEIWNRDFRNAIFHADYTLYGGEVRTVRPTSVYTHEQVMTIVNRAIAYYDALTGLYRVHIESYSEPVTIKVSPGFSKDPEENAIVIVREGHGAVGLKDAWTSEQIQLGKIPFRVGTFTREEIEVLDKNPTLAKLPKRYSDQTKGGQPT